MSKKKGVLFLREEYGNGFGKYKYIDGNSYEGEWKDGKYDGQGTYTYPDGWKYVGKYKDGKEHGQGTFTLPIGEKYVGEFKENEPWNISVYDKNGNLIEKVVNGEWIEQ